MIYFFTSRANAIIYALLSLVSAPAAYAGEENGFPVVEVIQSQPGAAASACGNGSQYGAQGLFDLTSLNPLDEEVSKTDVKRAHDSPMSLPPFLTEDS